MPLPAELNIDFESLPDQPKTNTDPVPFDIDGYVNEWSKERQTEAIPVSRNAFSKAVHWFSRPFFSQGYNGMAAVNRGVAGFSAHLDSIADYVEASTGLPKGGIFEKAADILTENAEYWQKRADKVGVGFFDELISEAVGGFVPGVTQFSLDVASALTFPYMAGTIKARDRGDDPFFGGMLEAAKTGILAGLFRMMAPLKQYLKAPTMGTVFGIQEMGGAPEGEKVRAFGKGFGTGLGYSLASPGGRLGLNEIKKGIAPELEKIKANVKVEVEKPIPEVTKEKIVAPAASEEAVPAKPEAARVAKAEVKNQRKFLKTAEESATTEADLAKKVTEIDPQDYVVQPNIESMGKAKKRVDTEGVDKTIDYLKSDADLNAEKGATFIEMMDRFQKAGDYGRAIEVIETYDTQLREAGRFVQSASIWNRLTPAGFIRWGEKQLGSTKSKYGWLDTLFNNKPESFTFSPEEKKAIFEKMTEINKMPDGADKTDATLQVIDMVAKKTPPSISELIDAYRYQNMLSSPKTQQRNIGENIGNAFITRPIDITTRGAIDYIKAGMWGKERQAYVSDTPVYIKTAINAVPNGAKAFMQVMKAEKGMEIGKPDVGAEVKSEFERARFKQIPAPLTVVTRFMEASDKFFSSIIGAGEFAVLKKRGATDAEAYKRATEIGQKYLYRDKLDPTDPDLSYFSKILSSTGKMINDSRKLPGLGALSKWYVPFIRTPVNKGIQMVEHSPLGLARGKFDQEAMAKIISGSIVTAIGAGFAYEGDTTWAVPSDPKEKELFYASGRKPYSVRVGDRWIPVWYLGPFAMAFAIPAAIKYYTYDQKKALTQGSLDKIMDIANGTARFVGSQTSTQSIGALFSALSGDVDYTFPATTAFTLGQVIPGSGLVRYVNTIIDPVYRKPKGFIEQIEKDLPFLSQRLEEITTPLFDVAKRDPVNYFIPYDVGKSDPVYEMMLPQTRYEIRGKNIENEMRKLSEQIQKGNLSAEESLDRLAELFGANLKSLQMFGEELEIDQDITVKETGQKLKVKMK